MTRSHGPTRLRSVLLAGVLVIAATFAQAPSASADVPYGHPMPGGRWTHVYSDSYHHYACKIPMNGAYGPVYRVKTATWFNGHHSYVAQGIGVYAVVTRGHQSNVVDTTSNNGWLYGFNGNQLWASAYFSDRLWIQAAAYGPVDAWTEGVPVRNLVTC